MTGTLADSASWIAAWTTEAVSALSHNRRNNEIRALNGILEPRGTGAPAPDHLAKG